MLPVDAVIPYSRDVHEALQHGIHKARVADVLQPHGARRGRGAVGRAGGTSVEVRVPFVYILLQKLLMQV